MRCVVRSERIRLAATAFAVLVLGLAASTGAAQKTRAKRRGENARCLEVRISSAQAQDGRRSRRFSATEILDLIFEVPLHAGIGADQQVTVKVFTPDGHLYQDLPLTKVAEGDDGEPSAPRSRRHRERAGPGQSKKARGPGTVSALFPVAGTSIVTSSLYGEWTATATIDGVEAPCARSASFEITQ